MPSSYWAFLQRITGGKMAQVMLGAGGYRAPGEPVAGGPGVWDAGRQGGEPQAGLQGGQGLREAQGPPTHGRLHCPLISMFLQLL